MSFRDARNAAYLVTLTCFAALLAACAKQQSTTSGFLGNYDQLQTEAATNRPFQPRVTTQRPAPGLLVSYTGVLIDPVQVSAEGLDSDQKAALASALEEGLRTEIGKSWPITSIPAQGVLKVRVAVTGVTKSNVMLNVVTSAAIGPLSNGGAAGEVEVVDAVSGARVAAMTWADEKRFSDPIGFYSQTGHARSLMQDFARNVASLLRR